MRALSGVVWLATRPPSTTATSVSTVTGIATGATLGLAGALGFAATSAACVVWTLPVKRPASARAVALAAGARPLREHLWAGSRRYLSSMRQP